MLGDSADMSRRMRATLPAGWFSDNSPALLILLGAISNCWAGIFSLWKFCVLQSRVRTATDYFLDLASADFFGCMLRRRLSERDDNFRARILTELLRPRSTRAALIAALEDITGQTPLVFEPARTSDTGGYRSGGVGYASGGGWGNLNLPYQFFISVQRPSGGGIANLAGFGSGGIPVYGSLAMEISQLSDNEIFSAIPPVLPIGTIAWARIAS